MALLVETLSKFYGCHVYEPEEGSKARNLVDRAKSIIKNGLDIEHNPRYVVIGRSKKIDKLLKNTSCYAVANADYVLLFYPVLEYDIEFLLGGKDVTKDVEAIAPGIRKITSVKTIMHETIGSYLNKIRKDEFDTLKGHFISEMLEYSTTYLLIKKEVNNFLVGKEVKTGGKAFSTDELLRNLLEELRPNEEQVTLSAHSYFITLGLTLYVIQHSQNLKLSRDLQEKAIKYMKTSAVELKNLSNYKTAARDFCSLVDKLDAGKVKEFFDEGREAATPEEIIEIANRLI